MEKERNKKTNQPLLRFKKTTEWFRYQNQKSRSRKNNKTKSGRDQKQDYRSKRYEIKWNNESITETLTRKTRSKLLRKRYIEIKVQNTDQEIDEEWSIVNWVNVMVDSPWAQLDHLSTGASWWSYNPYSISWFHSFPQAMIPVPEHQQQWSWFVEYWNKQNTNLIITSWPTFLLRSIISKLPENR